MRLITDYLLIKFKQMRILVRKFEKENLRVHFTFTLLMMVLLVAIPVDGFSQNEPVVTSRMNFETGMSLNRAVIGKFNSLSKTIKSSIYVENNQIKISQPNPVSLFTDCASIQEIDNLIPNKSSIEYVSIKVKNPSDIASFIRLSRFSNFSNLKYIHVLFEYEISNSEMESLIRNPSFNCYVVYESRKIM
jgi:hypothetical protein